MSTTPAPIRTELDADSLTDYQRRTVRVTVADHQAARVRMSDELDALVEELRAHEFERKASAP